jgi:molybdopterin-synthase adenylyltransferase
MEVTGMLDDRYSRQSFLGEHAETWIGTCVVGIIGLGGGGSHIVQQLAHIGFLHYNLYDGDIVKDHNLNRLIGATRADAVRKLPKIEVARCVILGLQLGASIEAYQERWQEHPEPLRGCDLIFGCVDGLAERRELEACARRYLIPYIDIGVDVHTVGAEPPQMAGQVILSMPGEPCLTCMGFLSETDLAREAAQYGDAGSRPQVV